MVVSGEELLDLGSQSSSLHGESSRWSSGEPSLLRTSISRSGDMRLSDMASVGNTSCRSGDIDGVLGVHASAMLGIFALWVKVCCWRRMEGRVGVRVVLLDVSWSAGSSEYALLNDVGGVGRYDIC